MKGSVNSRRPFAFGKALSDVVVEGREREAALMNGRWEDDIMMGLLDHAFRP